LSKLGGIGKVSGKDTDVERQITKQRGRHKVGQAEMRDVGKKGEIGRKGG
jgi:hypothetical protein